MNGSGSFAGPPQPAALSQVPAGAAGEHEVGLAVVSRAAHATQACARAHSVTHAVQVRSQCQARPLACPQALGVISFASECMYGLTSFGVHTCRHRSRQLVPPPTPPGPGNSP